MIWTSLDTNILHMCRCDFISERSLIFIKSDGSSAFSTVRACAWWERSQDGGAEGGAVLRTVLWKSEQRQQCLRLSRQTHWQRSESVRRLSEQQGKAPFRRTWHFNSSVKCGWGLWQAEWGQPDCLLPSCCDTHSRLAQAGHFAYITGQCSSRQYFSYPLTCVLCSVAVEIYIATLRLSPNRFDRNCQFTKLPAEGYWILISYFSAFGVFVLVEATVLTSCSC